MSALLAVLLSLGALDAGTQLRPVDVSVRAEPQQVRLGEPFLYEVRITHSRDERYELRGLKDLGAFELASQERSREEIPGSQNSATTFQLRFAAFELGELLVPELVFDVVSPEGTGVYRAKGPAVKVQGALSEEAVQKGEALYDIRPIAEVPVRSLRLVWLGLAAAAALLAAFLLFRRLRRPRAVVAAPKKPLEPVDVRSMAALADLLLQNLHGQRRFREFHFRLSEIVRGYLGERFGFDALECTSHELLAALGTRFTPGLQREALSRLVTESDIIKFAKGETTADACLTQLEFARELIRSTTAAVTPPLPGQDRAARPVS